MKYQVLMVEDDSRFCKIISGFFAKHDLEVTCADNGDKALALFDEQPFDLVLLDVGLSGALDGFYVCKMIRAQNQTVPVMFVTARGDIDDQLRGVGAPCRADDYIVKPYSEQVLLLKSITLIERAKGLLNSSRVRRSGGIEMNLDAHEVFIGGELIPLKPRQFDLLAVLLESAGRVLSRQQLLDTVWGYDFYGDDRVVDQSVKKLRDALGAEGARIQTLHRVGYKLMKP
ncbi:MAG: response regulator transcription factor [Oscillospiraceae bacterium]|jgi:DNA-binding response OmpR family regulator|nr:response regulator transcription factor [Oscillospiraceae bacterium]